MMIIDQIFLVSTTVVSGLALKYLLFTQQNEGRRHRSIYFHAVSLGVLGLAALLLAVLGWQILGLMGDATTNKLVAIISSLIPFAWATGLISKFYSTLEKPYLGLMLLGLILITTSRFIEAPLMSRIVYPVFHSMAAIVVISTPILAFRRGVVNKKFLLVSLGGALISMGGISLSFLMAGKQLLFFSQDFVLMILAPLLFVTGSLYFLGLSRGEEL